MYQFLRCRTIEIPWLLTISFSLRSIKIRSARPIVPMNCKPSNYSYNRSSVHLENHHLFLPIAPKESFLSRSWAPSGVCPRRKYFFFFFSINGDVVKLSFASPYFMSDVVMARMPLSFRQLHFPFDFMKISLLWPDPIQSADPLNVPAMIDLVHRRIDLATLIPDERWIEQR